MISAPPVLPAKQRFPLALAVRVGEELIGALAPGCDQIILAGSVRRRKPYVGDIEIVYVPKIVERVDPNNMFGTITVDVVDDYIAALERVGAITRRLNKNGQQTFGPKNKLMRHVASGIPVDLFATSAASWWNYLVCRTGPSASNIEIAAAAKARGWRWTPYAAGFAVAAGLGERTIAVHNERQVFELVGLPYREPWERS